MIKTTIALAAALGFAMAAPAQANAKELQLQLSPQSQTMHDETVGVVHEHRSTGGVIIGDALGGAVAGAAVGGGVALYNRYISNGSNGSWGNWQQDIAIGAAVGLGVGLVFGVVDAASNSDRTYMNSPVADKHESGFSAPVGMYGKNF